ncbi:hypothetical protein NKR23_g2010 [Pleurostoma richardsiae]|uniref:Uncharacterized protein n=1 Tax=Pleurostoma richardsiae TaxID=41990 RepID=A0AA38S3H8_9PEZI|nr:hypothetical protein NKR23_g2010 [Pleurostoma richardsiae]
MKPSIPPRSLPLRALLAPRQEHQRLCVRLQRCISTSPPAPASVAPVYGTGPPPEPPVPSAEHPDARIARRRRQAELLRQAQGLRGLKKTDSNSAKAAGLKRRFWQHVDVKEVDGAYEIHLDTRPLRHPTTKSIIRLPLSKPHLAHALALEWDLLTSAQQATRQHLIPLTSLVCRALDIGADDAEHEAAGPGGRSSDRLPFAPIRTSIATVLLRYLDTDSLLCWAPPPDPLTDGAGAGGVPLRDLQERTAGSIVRFLTSEVWPGVEIHPVLDGSSIVPRAQKPGVREVVQGWVMGLQPWDLAGLERATLAGKGLLGAARLVAEWSEGSAGRGPGRRLSDLEGAAEEDAEGAGRFGVEEAARAANLEVDWQTGRWGEVEDTHDVEKEDLRRQLGSVILLVSGTGSTR